MCDCSIETAEKEQECGGARSADKGQTKREAKVQQQADVIRQAEQPVIKLPEVLEQNATSPMLGGPRTRHCGN